MCCVSEWKYMYRKTEGGGRLSSPFYWVGARDKAGEWGSVDTVPFP